MKIAALQLSNTHSQNQMESYLKAAMDAKARVIVFGEYLLHPFFKELEITKKTKHSLLEKIHQATNGILALSQKYNLVMVVPIFEVTRDRIFKTILVLNKGKALHYRAQRLMPYAHWDETGFFCNAISKHIKLPLVFNTGGFKCAVVFGYELHFDSFWLKLKKESVDCVLLPTASTFDSSLRWRNLIKMRAFLNSCYILRANRIGQYQDTFTQTLWSFYGDSLCASPNGEIMDCLGNRDGLLVVNVDKKVLQEAKECWRFH